MRFVLRSPLTEPFKPCDFVAYVIINSRQTRADIETLTTQNAAKKKKKITIRLHRDPRNVRNKWIRRDGVSTLNFKEMTTAYSVVWQLAREQCV